jgi:hypothetical protein
MLANRRTLCETGREEERHHLDEHDQRQDVDRNARRHEQLEEFQAVLVEAVDQDREEHQQRQRRGDDDVARNREGVGDDADQVRDQMNMNSENTSGKNFMPSCRRCCGWCWRRTRRRARRSTAAAGHQLPPAAADHQQRDHRHRAEHVERRIGEGDLLIADVADREDLVDIELMDRIDFHPRGISWSAGHAGNRNSIVVTSRRASRLLSGSRPPISPR